MAIKIGCFAKSKSGSNSGSSNSYSRNNGTGGGTTYLYGTEQDPIFTESAAREFTRNMLEILDRFQLTKDTLWYGDYDDEGFPIKRPNYGLTIDSSLLLSNHNIIDVNRLEAKYIKAGLLDTSTLNVDNLFVKYNIDTSTLHSKEITNDFGIHTNTLDASTINSKNINNSEKITTKDLTVTGTALFFELIIEKIKSVGGSILLTPADGFTIDKIDNKSNCYRLYWKNQDDAGNKRDNMWLVNDQALCKSFNQAKVGTSHNVANKNYWCLVTAVSSSNSTEGYNWIEISKTDKEGTVNPEIGDSIVMCGTRDNSDPSRQSAIYISAYDGIDTGLHAPFIALYRGINNFDLASHRSSYFDSRGAKFIGNVELGGNGKSIEDYVKDEIDYAIHPVFVKTTETYYGSSNQGTNPAAVANWSKTMPFVPPENYLWTKIHIIYTDNSTSDSYTSVLMGWQGDPGIQGESYYHLIPNKEVLLVGLDGKVKADLVYQVMYGESYVTNLSGFTMSFAWNQLTGTGSTSAPTISSVNPSNSKFTLSNSALITDYHTTYKDSLNSITVSLKQGSSVVSTRVVPVVFESGAMFKVDNDLGIISGTVADQAGLISTLTLTASSISSTVADQAGLISNLTLTVSGISSTVSDNTGKISNLTLTVNGISSTVSGHTTSLSNLSGDITSLQGSISGINSDISDIKTLTSKIQTADLIKSIVSAEITTATGEGGTITKKVESIVDLTATSIAMGVVNDGLETAGLKISADGTNTFTGTVIANDFRISNYGNLYGGSTLKPEHVLVITTWKNAQQLAGGATSSSLSGLSDDMPVFLVRDPATGTYYVLNPIKLATASSSYNVIDNVYTSINMSSETKYYTLGTDGIVYYKPDTNYKLANNSTFYIAKPGVFYVRHPLLAYNLMDGNNLVEVGGYQMNLITYTTDGTKGTRRVELNHWYYLNDKYSIPPLSGSGNRTFSGGYVSTSAISSIIPGENYKIGSRTYTATSTIYFAVTAGSNPSNALTTTILTSAEKHIMSPEDPGLQ